MRTANWEEALEHLELRVAASLRLGTRAGHFSEPQHVSAACGGLLADEAIPSYGPVAGLNKRPAAHNLSGPTADRFDSRASRHCAAHAVAEVGLALTAGDQLL